MPYPEPVATRRELLLDEFLEDWVDRRTKGQTVEAVLTELRQHVEEDRGHFKTINERLAEGGEKMAKTEGKVDVITARHKIIPSSDPPSSQLHVSKAFMKRLSKLFMWAALVALGALARHFGWPDPSPVLVHDAAASSHVRP